MRYSAGGSPRAGRGGGIPLEYFRRTHPTGWGVLWIGRELRETTPDWLSSSSGPAPCPRLRERPGQEFAEGRAGFAQAGSGADEGTEALSSEVTCLQPHSWIILAAVLTRDRGGARVEAGRPGGGYCTSLDLLGVLPLPT